MVIRLTVEPAANVQVPANVHTLALDISYTSETIPTDGEVAEPVPHTRRVTFDADMRVDVQLDDASDQTLTLEVLAIGGVLTFTKNLSADSAGNAEWVIGQAEMTEINNVHQQLPSTPAPLRCTRSVRLVPTTAETLDYRKYHAYVSPVMDQSGLGSGVLAALATNGTTIASMEMAAEQAAALSGVNWSQAHLAIDGTITATFDKGSTKGWYWWLSGERQLAGFIPDDLAKADKKDFVSALPALNSRGRSELVASKEGCDRSKLVSANVTEAEVVNNPSVYAEDPGAFCTPFSNPERVLSEKSFSVIARVTQPEIGAVASTNTRATKLLQLDGDASDSRSTAGVGGFIRTLFSSTAQPTETLRNASAIRHIIPKNYLDFLKNLPSGRGLMSSTRPLQWEDDIAQYQAATVSIGHILEFRVRWRSNGYSLGTVSSTLTLAPRQTKRIQKVEWERSERARRGERTRLSDSENDSVTRERDYHDNVSANLSEWARGSSHSDVAGIAAGIGFFASGVLGGIGGGAGSSNSSSFQEGGRKTSASEHQRLRDAVRRHGDALRKFESTVVTEITQEENVTGTTEVLRNINYAHSLTVIYYQILRHLKVDTDFAGVRECLFVPFSIKPFDIDRAYRWREAIQSAIRSKRFLRALRYLKDVATNFSTSDIPPGARAQQELTYLRGSIHVDLAIERPRDKDDGSLDPGPWSTFQHLLNDPMRAIHSFISGMGAAERDHAFQSQYAQGIAAKWANRIKIKIGGNSIRVDSTLATAYRFNRGVRIDFVVPSGSLAGLRRTDLETVEVIPRDNLPPGSVANLTRLSFSYNTERFERSIQGRTGTNDLIHPVTGRAESAEVSFPLDSWELVNERLEIRRSVRDLLEHLNEHVEYYHKAIWWRMDRDRLLMMLDGFYVPNTVNVSIASVVDREPIGIIGNCLVYQVGAASFLGYGTIKTPEELYDLYAEKEPARDPVLVSLPTDGLYAQAIMDKCGALEEHFGNLDWALNDKDPELGSMDPALLASRRSDIAAAATAPTPFPATIINLQNAPDAPAPSGLQGVLNAVTNPNAFRDMAGLAGTQANALAGLQTAANLATNFGNQAAALELAKLAKAQEAARTADQKIATIQRAKDKGLTTEEVAAQQTREVLASMNPDAPRAQAPHENPVINKVIERMPSAPGSKLTASTGEGSVTLDIGGEAGAVVNASTGGGGGGAGGSGGGSGEGTGGSGGTTSAPVTVAINGSTLDNAAYVAWAPIPCTVRSDDGSAQRVLIRNVPSPGGGQLIFLTALDQAPEDEIIVDIPALGAATFFTCGRFDRLAGVGFASTNDKDTAIVVSTLDAATELARKPMMVRVRKDANTLTAGERDRFLSALMQLNQPGGVFVDFQNRHTGATNLEIHRRSSFLPWHRGFILDLERRMQEIDPSVALPYWRFDQPAPNVFVTDFMGVPTAGDPTGVVEFSPTNPLVNWRMQVLATLGSGRFSRQPSFNTATAASAIVASEADTIALGESFGERSDPLSFGRRMEGNPHGSAHISFGDDDPIGDIGLAPGDPLFFLLHCNVDRLWAKWQWLMPGQRFNPTQVSSYPNQGTGDASVGGEAGIGNFTDDTMWPWNGATRATSPPRPVDAPGGPLPDHPTIPNPGPRPTVASMIDFQGQFNVANQHGYGYDDVPYDHPGDPIAI